MGRNLTNLYISESFQYLIQVSGSELQTGLGTTLTGSLLITASRADLATTASYALNAGATVSTSSLLVTASAVASTITFTKGDGSTFNVIVSQSGSVASASYADFAVSSSRAVSASQATSASYSNTSTSASYALVSTTSSFAINANSASYALNSTSASFAVTASYALNTGPTVSSSFASTASLALLNVLTASSTNDTITYTKGNATTFTNVINNVTQSVSASFATSASQAVSASFAVSSSRAVSSSFATSASVSTSASYANTATSASYALSASQAQNAISASYYGGSVVSASYAATSSYATNFNVDGTITALSASIQYLTVIYETSSVIYSSGSNQFGDATNDTQSLFGRVKVTGSFEVTGSATFANGITGSLLGTASFATSASQAVSASFATSASFYGGSVVSASYAATSSLALAVSTSISSQNLQHNVLFVDTSGPGFVQVDAGLRYNPNTDLLTTTSSFAVSASQAVSSSFATTASFALNAGASVNTGSLLVTASAASNVITFTKGDASTFNVTVATGSATFPYTGSAIISGSLGVTGSINLTSGSFSGSVITNITDVYTTSPRVNQVITLTQTEYNAIGSPDANTLYIISGSVPLSTSGFATTGSNTFIGNQIVTGSVTATAGFTGSLFGTASFSTSASQAQNAVSASFATTASFALNVPTINTGSFATTGSNTFIGNEIISGSLNISGSITSSNVVGNWTDTFTGSAVVSQIVTCTQAQYITVSGSANASNTLYVITDASGSGQYISGSLTSNVNTLTIASSTASLDCSTGNFFIITLPSSSGVQLNPTNIQSGQTINLQVNQAAVTGAGLFTYPSSIKQVSGSSYTPTGTAGAVDIVTFIAFNTASLFLSNIKNFI
jgi:hypothetical protein